ncbi:MAG: HEPN domain-containing protein [Planctomycetota bacterium]
MKSLTAEWVSKATEDYSVAAGLARRKILPANSICFHCHQCAEKLLKALLQEAGIPFGKTHDLEVLMRQACVPWPAVTSLHADFVLLNDYAVATGILVSTPLHGSPGMPSRLCAGSAVS